MKTIELTAGTIEYEDTGGDGPTVVLLHGLTMDGSLWRNVLPHLGKSTRCILPTLPLGGHRIPMHADADLSLRALAHLVAEFIEKLDLHDVILVGNDWGGAQLLVSERVDARIGKLVLIACEAFDNYPPGFAARTLSIAARFPGGVAFMLQPMRFHWLRTRKILWGSLMKRPASSEVLDQWFLPAIKHSEIRRDLGKYLVSVPDRTTLLDWSNRQARFDRPVTIIWAVEDQIMPAGHGRRLADLFQESNLVEIRDSYTLVPIDQPELLGSILHQVIYPNDPS